MSDYSFDELCLPWYPELINFALKLSNGDRAQAQDIVQDSLLKAYKAWDRWVPQGDPLLYAKAWLNKIVANEFTNVYNQNKNRSAILYNQYESIVDSLLDATVVPTGRGDVTVVPTLNLDVEISHEVQEALERINQDQRQVIEMVCFQNLTAEQVSKKLAIPSGTVRSRLERGLLALSRILSPYAREYGYDKKLESGAREDSAPFKPTKVVETNADTVQTVVRDHDVGFFAVI